MTALKLCDRSVVQSADILPSSALAAHIVSLADLVLDQEGHAYSVYHAEAGRTKVFAIRPDGVIGAIVRGVEAMKKYFSRIFVGMQRGPVYSLFAYKSYTHLVTQH